MDNCAARNQIKVHTSNLSSIIEENISLRFSFEEYIIWLARTKLLGLAISNSSKTEVIMHRAAEVSFVRKQITVLISIALAVLLEESFAAITLFENTSALLI